MTFPLTLWLLELCAAYTCEVVALPGYTEVVVCEPSRDLYEGDIRLNTSYWRDAAGVVVVKHSNCTSV